MFYSDRCFECRLIRLSEFELSRFASTYIYSQGGGTWRRLLDSRICTWPHSFSHHLSMYLLPGMLVGRHSKYITCIMHYTLNCHAFFWRLLFYYFLFRAEIYMICVIVFYVLKNEFLVESDQTTKIPLRQIIGKIVHFWQCHVSSGRFLQWGSMRNFCIIF